MTSKPSRAATRDVVAWIAAMPGAEALEKQVAEGGALAWDDVAAPAWPFVVALLRSRFPQRPIVAVTLDLKAQESFHQDLQTWLAVTTEASADPKQPIPTATPLFYPAWEAWPHQGQLPHADVISERLETLIALAGPPPAGPTEDTLPDRPSRRRFAPLVVTSIGALLQRTVAPDWLRARHRTLRRGDRLDPLDLIEWLEDQAYEPEAQVTRKGELALRGGIVDIYPLTSPWPVRLEFFGDVLESLRYFDPQTQISREETEQITLAPAGEIGLLRQYNAAVPARGNLLR